MKPSSSKKLRRVLSVSVLIGLALVVYFTVSSRSRSRDKQRAIETAKLASIEEALPPLRACLEREPHDPDLLEATTQLLIRSQAPIAEIEHSLEQWVAVSPNNVEAHLVRARFYNAVTRYELAMESAERCMELAPDRFETRVLHGQIALKLGRWEAAANSLAKAAELGGPPVFLPLARAELELGHRDSAMTAIDRELQRNPQSPEALALRATVEFRDGNYAGALRQFEKCPAGTPTEREYLLFHIGQCQERLGRADIARKSYDDLRTLQNAIHLDAAARQQPENVALQVQTSNAWLAAGEPRLALQIVQETLGRSGPTRDLLMAAAACYDALQQPAEAARTRGEAQRLP